jgi:hypothetical protein
MTPKKEANPYTCILAAISISVSIGLIILIRSHAFSVGFSGSDEPSHFLNGYFVNLYFKSHFGENPLNFAKAYYLHYPKISIGHWPPAFYGFVGLLFFVLPASFTTVFSINLAFQIILTTVIAITVNHLSRMSIAVIAALVYSLTPISVESVAMFMPDGAVATFAIASVASWLAYASNPSFKAALLFSAFAAVTVLIKGNGWLVAFVPVFHLLLTNQWRVLASPKLYAAAAIGGIVVVPWYFLTAKLSAAGFNYQAGIPYATHALLFNMSALARNVGTFGLLLAFATALAEYRDRNINRQRWTIVAGCISLALATLLLQSIIPVDTVDRYMAPALPPVLVLAFLGVDRIISIFRYPKRLSPAIPAVLVMACTIAMIGNGAQHLLNRNPKIDIGIREMVEFIDKDKLPHAVLVDGSAPAEGAVIAALAVMDDKLQNYAIRSSKILAQSNFMGSDYALQYGDAAQTLAGIRNLGIRYVVTVREGRSSPFPHCDQLDEALQLPQSGYKKVIELPINDGNGSARVFMDESATRLNVDGIIQASFPEKLSSLQKMR